MTEGPGERAEKARQRRFSLIWGGFMVLGGMIGALLVALGPDRAGTIPAALAIAAAALFVIAIPLGSWYFLRDVDEVEQRTNMVASIWGLNAYVMLYPAWYILWKGQLVREPDHEILFITTMIVLSLVYFWKKARP
ncbi:MAG: hypothetical protein V4808_16815 [Pseudomonadota bacterium]